LTQPRQTICLCMIVRDEAAVIERCLTSCRNLIDHWVICDTGSRDSTVERIRHTLAGIPGELHRRPWVDFGHNRTELMTFTRGQGDYLLLIDADMTIISQGPRPRLTADTYLLQEGDETFAYRNRRLVRGDLAWRYVGSTHEYLECPTVDPGGEALDWIRIEHHADGGSRADKFARDRRLLEAEMRDDPGNARATFYLAQTYRDLAGEDVALLTRARDLYQRRAELGGWAEEVYYAGYQVGVLSARLGDWPRAADAFMTAWEIRPQRLEAVHDLAAGLIERERYHAAHRFTRLATVRPGPALPDDALFVSPWVYRWGMLFQHSIAAYWCGDYDASIDACRRLLATVGLPESHRRHTERNLRYAAREKVAALAQAPAPVLLWPHAGHPTVGRAAVKR
jgi:hypothetical protein